MRDGNCPQVTEGTRQWIRTPAKPSARPAPVAAAARGIDISMAFLKGSAELTGGAKAAADQLAQAIAKRPGVRYRIEGHTDSSGTRAGNLELSRARAQAVVDYLVGRGVEAGRLEPVGYGPDRPLPGRAKSDPANRRVEISRAS